MTARPGGAVGASGTLLASIRGVPAVHIDRVQDYLRTFGHPDAEILSSEVLGASVQADLKAHGYGRPLRVRFRSAGRLHDVVIRTARPDAFGHDRRADRVYQMALAEDTFGRIPRHVPARAAGTFAESGALVPFAPGEPFLVTDFVEGELYATDLQALEGEAHAAPRDLERARVLARYLAELHAVPATAVDYQRCVRDTLGDGEGIFGITDGYPRDLAVASPARLCALEKTCVEWRWRLKAKGHRSRRTHGDFHPFNLLFREPAELSVLDASRGGVGEPADDLTCLSINFLFFALVARGRFEGALRELWTTFWQTYLHATGDHEVLEVVAPFFTWRALVLACPAWYPSVSDAIRDRVLTFAERLLDGARFDPTDLEALGL